MKSNFYLLLILFHFGLYAQNSNNCGTPIQNEYVINGGFEQVLNNNQYPNSTGQIPRACNWFDNANTASPDYFHGNSTVNSVSIPTNQFGNQNVNPIFGGNAYAGVQAYPVDNSAYTEIIATELQNPLQPFTNYVLSFDVSKGDFSVTNLYRLQALLSNQLYTINNSSGELPIQGNANNILLENNAFLNNTTGWDRVTIPFTTGAGGQQYLYLGGISNIAFQSPDTPQGFPAYYYIDNVSLVEQGVTPNLCTNESITITSEIPDCNVFENSNTFDICGTFTTNATSTYNLSLNRTDLDSPPFPQIPSLPITNISNITTTNGITSGEFCITLNATDFNLNNNYQIDVRINSQINGQACSATSNVIMLPFNDCTTTTCPDCKSDIMENISIVPTTNCNTFEFNIPELSDCFEVIYALNNVDQGQLPEGTSPLTLNENGSYSIQIGVIDIETGKACAKRTFKIDVECSDEPCPDCNKEILENISIVQSKDCNSFEIYVPELFDCYKVAYSIDNAPQETLPEGTSTISFEDNGFYSIKFGVFDLETNKACAKKIVNIEVDCEPTPSSCDWLKSIGTTNGNLREEQGTSVVVDSNNDVILLGRSLPNASIEGTVVSGTTYLSKYSPDGCLISATDISFIGVPVDMEINNNDELLILTKDNYGVNSANNNYYLNKLDSTGNLIWTNTYSYNQGSGSGTDDVKMYFKKSTGEVFLLTTINSPINITDSTSNTITIQNIPSIYSVVMGSIVKTSPNGTIDWSQTIYSRMGVRSYSIAVSENTDELFFLGAGSGGYNIPYLNEMIFRNNNTGNENIVNTIPSNNATPNTIDFIAKINTSNGAYNSISFFPDWGFSYAARLAYNHNTNSLFVIPGLLTTNAQVLNSNLIIQNNFGDYRFTKSVMVNGDYLYTTGGSNGRFFVAKMNSSGIIWIKKPSNQFSVSNDIAIKGDKIYTTGYFRDNNISLGNGNQIEHVGEYDGFLTRLTDNGSSAVFLRKIDESTDTDSKIILYPNPASDELTVKAENFRIESIEVYNIYGKTIQTIKTINAFKQEIDVARLVRGYYVIKVTLEDGSTEHKNVILK